MKVIPAIATVLGPDDKPISKPLEIKIVVEDKYENFRITQQGIADSVSITAKLEILGKPAKVYPNETFEISI